jgi:hypothetical protein
MSSRSAIEQAEKPDTRTRSRCKVCSGQFVAHSYYERTSISFPEDVCVWCATRSNGQMLKRFELLEKAVLRIAKKRCLKGEAEDCRCSPCLANRALGMLGA